jgi:hypothetical protein
MKISQDLLKINVVAEHVIMRTNVEAPVKRKNLRSTQYSSPLIDSPMDSFDSIDLSYKKYSGVLFH